jgi:hypothetical protein
MKAVSKTVTNPGRSEAPLQVPGKAGTTRNGCQRPDQGSLVRT